MSAESTDRLPAGTAFKHEHCQGSTLVLTSDARRNGGIGWIADVLETRADGTTFQHRDLPFMDRYITIVSTVHRPAPPEKVKIGDWVESTIGGLRYVGKVCGFNGEIVRCEPVDGESVGRWQDWGEKIRPWKPQPGEWCEGQATHGSRVGAGKVVRGKFLNLTQDKSPVLDCPDETEDNGIDRAHRVKVRADSLRPIPPPNAPGSAVIGIDPAFGPGQTVTSWRCRSCQRVMSRDGSIAPTEAEFTCGECAAKPTTSAENGIGAPSRVAPNETTPSGHFPNRCSQPACPCPYCRHRPHSRILGATDPRYNDGKGPTHSTIDASIALAKAQHLSDLDRSSSSRRAAIGAGNPRLRMGVRLALVEGREHPWSLDE